MHTSRISEKMEHYSKAEKIRKYISTPDILTTWLLRDTGLDVSALLGQQVQSWWVHEYYIHMSRVLVTYGKAFNQIWFLLHKINNRRKSKKMSSANNVSSQGSYYKKMSMVKKLCYPEQFFIVSIPKKFIWKGQEHLLQLLDLENKEKYF
jgi:hypothetical protein